MNKPDAALLETFASSVARGDLKSQVSEVVSFSDLPLAIERNRTASRIGKVVVDLSR
jgi:NADPH:quinone reductase-like Zn-dependent oxidoreductase